MYYATRIDNSVQDYTEHQLLKFYKKAHRDNFVRCSLEDGEGIPAQPITAKEAKKISTDVWHSAVGYSTVFFWAKYRPNL